MPKKTVYLDYAAATPLDATVQKAMEPYFADYFFNPSANYSSSKEVKKAIEGARRSVAEIIGAKSSEIIFTAGATEANNLAVAGLMNKYVDANLIISAIEHPSVSAPAGNYDTQICPVDKNGLIKLSNLRELINDQTVLVSLIYASHEIGTIEPLQDVSRMIKEIRLSRRKRGIDLPLYLHSDAAQAANYLDLHTSRLGVDLMTLNGGKIYGPKQSGALFIKSDVIIEPLILGGGQERNLRSGTENVAAIIGFSKALSIAQTSKKENSLKTANLQSYFIDQLKQLPGAVINGPLTKRLVNNVHLTLKSIDNEWLLIKLDDSGIMAAAGSACSASSDEPSLVLRAIGLSDEEARSSIRFTLGRSTTKADLDYTLSVLKKLLT